MNINVPTIFLDTNAFYDFCYLFGKISVVPACINKRVNYDLYKKVLGANLIFQKLYVPPTTVFETISQLRNESTKLKEVIDFLKNVYKTPFFLLLTMIILSMTNFSYANNISTESNINNNINYLENIDLITSIITSIAMSILAYFTFKANFILKKPNLMFQDVSYNDNFRKDFHMQNNKIIEIINIGNENALNIKIFYKMNIEDLLKKTNNLNNLVKISKKEAFVCINSNIQNSYTRIIENENIKYLRPNENVKISIPFHIIDLFYEYCNYIISSDIKDINFPKINITCEYNKPNFKKVFKEKYEMNLFFNSIKTSNKTKKIEEINWGLNVQNLCKK